ncbi:hypothetical protein TBS_30930 [Thermobispora bispora]|uniref:Uncharacterized protein n=1 Tax=Thermobispora bispora (strain ATCC 19993 / DSM 43833 / CBS 139.67 / JCM 10125 / KCTC 9307 / NBRC 14880 / R51) TaxID=469371 RepID=D6Y7N2_THEBD|nr:hypothetical protein [Thermobispora bispora]ADG89743.1 hypothetical protein Tbis_3047 [Thermobispora bispora DSM 43833]QSI49922.1 hypothetical protein CYL17_18245 [Thermobispora bispora]QSI50024.1 hypothetical protein CYL17_18815 [Thermobispora bispora]
MTARARLLGALGLLHHPRTRSTWRYTHPQHGVWEITITGLLATQTHHPTNGKVTRTRHLVTRRRAADWLTHRHTALHKAGWQLDTIQASTTI